MDKPSVSSLLKCLEDDHARIMHLLSQQYESLIEQVRSHTSDQEASSNASSTAANERLVRHEREPILPDVETEPEIVSERQRSKSKSSTEVEDIEVSSKEGKERPSGSSLYKSRSLRALSNQDALQTHRIINAGCCTRMAQRALRWSGFEIISGLLILGSTCIMGLEIQYDGLNIAYSKGFTAATHSPEATMRGVKSVVNVTDIMFNICFAVEVIIRIVAGRARAFKSGYVLFDLTVVSLSFLEYGGSAISFYPSMLRLIRLMRICRVLRVMKSIPVFDTLFLLVRSIEKSMGALFWSFVVFFFLQTAIGMAISQMLQDYYLNDSYNFNERYAVYDYFGTFTKTQITMFEITFANWVPSCRTLVTNVSEWFGLFYIIYRCMICFAVIRVIAAIFISETTRVVAADDELVLQRRQRQRHAQTLKLKDLFGELDVSGDGYLTYEEFQRLLNDDLMGDWAESIGVRTDQLNELFWTLARCNDGQVSDEEFIQGVLKIQEGVRSVDALKLLAAVDRLEAQLARQAAQMEIAERRSKRALGACGRGG
eukprot:TRINITY_DN17070_c0_g1_i1.p1 TRINITY_DN17070_c0_g1~~TRINITY_DN17070_c0_g1_i1.p1  ORF type:complete len:542 (+),score=65.35 TRINITY_DN17070_c0_g1_i1:42-1667(+)